MTIKRLQHIPQLVSRKVTGYFALAALSFATVYFVHHTFADGRLRIPAGLLSAKVIGCLAVLLVLYFLADGLRLYCVIRAMRSRIGFAYIMKLVFINMFVSNVTPLATGGGVIQVYFMGRKGMPIGEATAATSTSETQGMVLIEAMAGGCPVVAVRASGVHDVVKDGYNGLTVAESTNNWAEAVAILLADRRRLSVMSENSLAFAENYSVERITEKVLKLYRRVVVLGKSKND